MAVNLGPSRASRIIQQAAAKASGSTVLADGVLGPATLAQINAMDEDRLVEFISCEWAGFYRNLAATRPEMEKLMKGWLARVEAYRPAQPKGLCAY